MSNIFSDASKRLLNRVHLMLFLLILPIDQAMALDFEIHKFSQCVYTVGKCECCKKADIIDGVYNHFAHDNRLYISEIRDDNRIIFLRYMPGKRAKKKGYLTFILQKSDRWEGWREVLAGRSIGAVSKASFGKYSGAYCLQESAEKGQLYAWTKDRYSKSETPPNSECISQPSVRVKKFFDPR